MIYVKKVYIYLAGCWIAGLVMFLAHCTENPAATPSSSIPVTPPYPYYHCIIGDTLIINLKNGDSLHYKLIDTLSGQSLFSENVLYWTPTLSDTGEKTVSFEVTDNHNGRDTLDCKVYVRSYGKNIYADFTHYYDVTVGDRTGLPEGYFICSAFGNLYKCPLRDYKPVEIIAAQGSWPDGIDLSSDGKWIVYSSTKNNNAYIIKLNGSCRTKIPKTAPYLQFFNFYRGSPYIDELYWIEDLSTVKAMRLFLSDDGVSFGAVRTLVSLDNTHQFTVQGSAALSGDRLFVELFPIINGHQICRSGFITIPDSGRGTATMNDIYKWDQDRYISTSGCAHTISEDGSLVCANPGNLGSRFVPHTHKGFFIGPFMRKNDPSIIREDYIERCGYCITWCLPAYNSGSWEEINFNRYRFSNNSDYLICHLVGDVSPVHGVWVVNWKESRWTLVTPAEEKVRTFGQALWIGPGYDSTIIDSAIIVDTSDTTNDPLDPHYRVISPNGGDLFSPGVQCTAHVSSAFNATAVLKLQFDMHQVILTSGSVMSIDPYTDSVFVFTIKKTYPVTAYNPATKQIETRQVSPVSEKCLIIIEDYYNRAYQDMSDFFFAIRPLSGD